MIRYLGRVTIAFSIFLNSLFGGRNNQTLSAQQYERQRQGKWNLCWIIDKLFAFEGTGHCLEAWIKWQIIHRAMDDYKNIAEKYYRKEVGYEKQESFKRML